MLLRREPYAVDVAAVLDSAAKNNVAVECNSSPSRLDLNDTHLRMAHARGCTIVVNTDAHTTDEFKKMRFGVKQLRRAWLTAKDVLNTRGPEQYLDGLRRRAQN